MIYFLLTPIWTKTKLLKQEDKAMKLNILIYVKIYYKWILRLKKKFTLSLDQNHMSSFQKKMACG